MLDIYKKIVEIQNEGKDAILCTIVKTYGHTPLKEGAKMIVCEETTYGSVGGGKVEFETIEKARKILKTTTYKLEKIELKSKEGTSCGGQVEIFYEPLVKRYKLYIFGAGHVGKALAGLAQNLDFDIMVIDNRDGIYNDWTNKDLNLINSNFIEFLENIQFDDTIFLVIITYDHKYDWEILSNCAGRKWHYLGMMGSDSKVKTMRKNLIELGISKEIINKIKMPIGLDINAETAEEIAVSISAELVQERSKLIRKLRNDLGTKSIIK